MTRRDDYPNLRAEYQAIADAHRPDKRNFCQTCFERYRPCDMGSAAQDVLSLLDVLDEMLKVPEMGWREHPGSIWVDTTGQWVIRRMPAGFWVRLGNRSIGRRATESGAKDLAARLQRERNR